MTRTKDTFDLEGQEIDEKLMLEEEIRVLRAALRDFMQLSWSPDGAPEPSCYSVHPVSGARAALVRAGLLLDGASPFPSDNDGSIMEIRDGDKVTRSVWLGGMAYPEEKPELVPKQYRDLFVSALYGEVAKR